MLDRIAKGRTDLIGEWLTQGNAVDATDQHGTSLVEWCAYFGDVSALRQLLALGATLELLGENLDLNGAAFHGHWQLCQFLVEQGANVNHPLAETGETPLHAALCTTDRIRRDRVIQVLLSHGANPNSLTKPGVATGAFMRDCRTRGESPLHRAAAYGTARTIQLLLDAGAKRELRDANGDSPLTWASWHLRPDSILRLLCFDNFRIHPARDPDGLAAYLAGDP